MVDVYLLPANQGDFIWIHYGKEDDWHNIIIDGGTARMNGYVRNTFEHILLDMDEDIDAVFLTHIDSDHIGGLVTEMPLIDEDALKNKVKAIYMNTGRGIRKKLNIADADTMNQENIEDTIEMQEESQNYSVAEAITWMKFLESNGFVEKEEGDTSEDGFHEYIIAGDKIRIGGAELEVISPGETELSNLLTKKWDPYKERKGESGNYGVDDVKLPEFCAQNLEELQKEKLKYDGSVNNKSSIAFIFRYGEVAIAFLGDAASGVCVKGLTTCGYGKTPKVEVDVVKLAHHGSNYNASDKLIQAFKTDTYMVSSNGENPNGGLDVPHKTTIAHLLKNHKNNHVKLLCNYNWSEDAYQDKYFTEQDKADYLNSEKLKLYSLSEENYEIKEKGLTIYGYWS